MFATGLHPSSAYVEREKFHYVLVPVVLSVTSLLQPTTLTLAGREGEVLSLITVWVDVTSYKSHTLSDKHREEE